ncbi:unnamed protein product [Prunus armeniaca]
MSSHPLNDSAFAFGPKLTAVPKLNTTGPNLRHQLPSFRHQLPKLTAAAPKLLTSAFEAYSGSS